MLKAVALFLLPLAVALPTPAVVKNPLLQHFQDYAKVCSLQQPGGLYKTSKSMLLPSGTLSGDLAVVVRGSSVDVDISLHIQDSNGASDVHTTCTNERMSFSAGKITLLDAQRAGNCIHNTLAASNVTISSVQYDAPSDSIVAVLSYFGVLPINLVLEHAQLVRNTPQVFHGSLAQLFNEKFAQFATASPSGSYSASTMVFGTSVESSIQVGASTFNWTLDSPLSLTCNGEAYSLSGSTFTITNINDTGDCMHDLASSWSVAFSSMTYDAAADTITAHVQFAGIPITLTYQHSSAKRIARYVPVFETREQFVSGMRSLAQQSDLEDPKGNYTGTKTILGQNVQATVSILDASFLGFTVSGVVSISCPKEAYTFSGNVITLTDLNIAGDCVHDALAANSVTLTSITFDSSKNEIDIKLKYSIVTISLELAHVNTEAFSMDVATVAHFQQALNLHDPAGTYKGTKSVLGKTVDVTVTILSATEVSVIITGDIPVDCPTEAYSYSNGNIDLPKVGNDGDCVHDALKANGVTFESAKYDAENDEISFTVKLIINITVVLYHE